MDDAETTNGPTRRLGVLGSVRLAVLAVVLLVIAVYVRGHWQEFSGKVAELRLVTLLWVLLLECAVYGWYALMLRSLMWPYGLDMSLREAAMVGMATRFGNIFLPMRGGAALRAAYLHRRHGLAPTQFLAGLAGAMMAPLSVSGVVCVVGLIWLGQAGGEAVNWAYIVPLATVPVVVGALAVWSPKLQPGSARLRRMLARILGGWRDLCRHARAMRALLAASVMHLLTLSGIFTVLFTASGIDLSYGRVVLIAAMGNASNIFMITPGNVGVYEAVIALGARAVGVPAEDVTQLVFTVLIWRVLDMAFVVATGGASTVALSHAVGESAQGKA
jgi:uncharacterized membrane protein YbhN (UPF0104 family)